MTRGAGQRHDDPAVLVYKQSFLDQDYGSGSGRGGHTVLVGVIGIVICGCSAADPGGPVTALARGGAPRTAPGASTDAPGLTAGVRCGSRYGLLLLWTWSPGPVRVHAAAVVPPDLGHLRHPSGSAPVS